MEVTCDFCGIVFNKKPSAVRKNNFHNRDCFYAFMRENGRGKQRISAYKLIRACEEL